MDEDWRMIFGYPGRNSISARLTFEKLIGFGNWIGEGFGLVAAGLADSVG